MSTSKIVALSILLAFAEARFGQEQIPVAAVRELGAAGFGAPGVAETLAGGIPSSLLAAASPCAKLILADQILEDLGNDELVVAAAIGLVAAETNFNPFAVDKPFVCADATLPENELLRGIIPLVDPAVPGSDFAIAQSELSRVTPFNADGLSVAEVMIAQGFSTFAPVDQNKNPVVLDGQNGGDAPEVVEPPAEEPAQDDEEVVEKPADDEEVVEEPADDEEVVDDTPIVCYPAPTETPVATPAPVATPPPAEEVVEEPAQDDNQDDQDNQDNQDGPLKSSLGLDFGLCQPTIARLPGFNGRKATEFTFIPQDPLCIQGQQEALNPNIITNRICDQLTNACGADQAAKDACRAAQAEINALGSRDQSTADTWNALLGFAGVDSAVEGL